MELPRNDGEMVYLMQARLKARRYEEMNWQDAQRHLSASDGHPCPCWLCDTIAMMDAYIEIEKGQSGG